MQIHEITQTQLDEGVGSFLGGVVGGVSNIANKLVGAVSPVGPAKDAYASAVRPQQIQMIRDKVYTTWKQYEKTLLQANPDARATGMYQKALLAFVTKNMLGGQYLPSVINRQQIETLVKQLSGSEAVTEADEVVVGAVKPGAPTPAERAKLQARIAAADKGAKPPPAGGATPPVVGTTAPAAPATPTATSAPAAPTAPASANTMANTPVSKTNTAKPGNPNATPPAPAALTPQQEKDLWLKLTQQSVVATTQAPGSQTANVPKDAGPGDGDEPVGDARSYQQQFTQSMDAAVVKGLPLFGNDAVKMTGNNRARSTGNPVADALLLMAGFRGV